MRLGINACIRRRYMAIEYRDLTCEQRSKMFDDILALLKEDIPVDQIKVKIMATYGLTDVWSCKNRFEISNLEEFIKRAKEWSERKVVVEDII
jgi:hypothetical protein